MSLQLADLSSVDVTISKNDLTPRLCYVASMSRAPTPFLRTTVLEIVPSFILVNDRSIPIWFREDPAESIMGITKVATVPYFKIEPKERYEFHPQICRKSTKIQVTGLPDVGRYFHKILKPTIQKTSMLRLNAGDLKR